MSEDLYIKAVTVVKKQSVGHVMSISAKHGNGGQWIQIWKTTEVNKPQPKIFSRSMKVTDVHVIFVSYKIYLNIHV